MRVVISGVIILLGMSSCGDASHSQNEELQVSIDKIESLSDQVEMLTRQSQLLETELNDYKSRFEVLKSQVDGIWESNTDNRHQISELRSEVASLRYRSAY